MFDVSAFLDQGRQKVQALQQTGQLPTSIQCDWVATCPSTNTALMHLDHTPTPHPHVLIALHQTAGRGRMGKVWHSATNGQALTLSIKTYLSFSQIIAGGLSLAIGVALAEVIGETVHIKWPNDLWWFSPITQTYHKLGGILIETAPVPHHPELRAVVIGVGINLETPTFSLSQKQENTLSVIPPATWSDVIEKPMPWSEAIAIVLPALLHAIELFKDKNLAPFLEFFKKRDALWQQSVQLSNGQTGVAQGLDAQGGLRLQTASGLITVTQHEVSLRLC